MEENSDKITEGRSARQIETTNIYKQNESEKNKPNELTNEDSLNKSDNTVNAKTDNFQKENPISSYRFNGHSNVEIILFFTLAFITSILFYVKQSTYINHVCYLV